jgi:hypothetical protein
MDYQRTHHSLVRLLLARSISIGSTPTLQLIHFANEMKAGKVE